MLLHEEGLFNSCPLYCIELRGTKMETLEINDTQTVNDASVAVEKATTAYRKKPVFDFFKRVFDIVASFLGLIILSPLFLVVSLLIFAEDKGNPFYCQTRIGKNGKPFKMFKFRSMCKNADQLLPQLQELNEVDGPVFKIKDDPRITKIGKAIRKCSIDELPQLLNILIGKMSVVCPRPPLPNEVEQYTEYQLQRLSIKGGLTCIWQVSGRSDLPFEDWVEMDLDYIKRRSPLLDLKLILLTVRIVFTGKGAY